MSDQKTMILPDREELLARLNSIDSDAYLNEHLYPLILKDAGQAKSGPAILGMVVLANQEYFEALPKDINLVKKKATPSGLARAIIGQDNPEVLEDAIRFGDQILAILGSR